jgi:hypothetical protein
VSEVDVRGSTKGGQPEPNSTSLEKARRHVLDQSGWPGWNRGASRYVRRPGCSPSSDR